MNTILVLGGYGEMGRVIAADLAETFEGRMIIAGRTKEKAQQFAGSFRKKNITFAGADISSPVQLVRTFSQADVVINATQYATNLQVMKAALRSGAHYVDLGGLFHVTRQQLRFHSAFKKAGLSAIICCGASPGITNVMAGYGVQQLSRIGAIHVSFAGKDWTHRQPFVVPYSMHTVFDEFSKRPAVYRNGRFVFLEPLGEKAVVPFPAPLGRIACYTALHSEVATFPLSFRQKGIRQCTFRGGWDPAFVEKVKFLLDSGFASEQPVTVGGSRVIPRELSVQLLNRFIPEKKKINDTEFLRVEILGRRGRRKKQLVLMCRARSQGSIPAGSWDTGVPASIAAQMLLDRRIEKRGVLPPERCIPPEPFFQELRKRNIIVYMLGEKTGKKYVPYALRD